MKTSIVKIFLLASALFIFVAPFEGCKKGSGDPAISFRSRKARVVGEWKVKKLVYKTTSVSTPLAGPVITITTELDNDGTKTTNTVTETNQSVNKYTFAESFAYKFNKDGTFTYSTGQENTSQAQTTEGPNSDLYNKTTVNKITIEMKGKWNFTSGIGKEKNKESILLVKTDSMATVVSNSVYVAVDAGSPAIAPLTETTVYTQTPTSQDLWKLTTLRNDKIIATGTAHVENSQTYNGNQNATQIITDSEFSIELDPK